MVASKHPAHPDGALAIPWAAIDTKDRPTYRPPTADSTFRTGAGKRRLQNRPLTRSVECDPFDLGVHRALPPTGTASLAEARIPHPVPEARPRQGAARGASPGGRRRAVGVRRAGRGFLHRQDPALYEACSR